MADKKITQNTEKVSAVIGTDVLPIVGNTATTPTNYKVQVKNFLSNFQIDLPQTTLSALKLTASVTAASVAATLAAGEFNCVANSSIGVTVRDRYGLIVSNKILNGNSIVTGQMAAAMFTLDSGNSVTAAANTYGIIVNHALDAAFTARVTPPRAFVAVSDDAGTNAAARTTYLFDLKAVSSNTGTANAGVVFSRTADKVATHTLKLVIEGQDVWILCSNTAPA
jgi:hypothetical protein